MVRIKNIDYTDLILKMLIVIFGGIAIYWLALKIIGNSPNLSEINLILIVMLITSTLNFYYRFGRFEGKVSESIDNTKNSFKRIREDIKELKQKQHL